MLTNKVKAVLKRGDTVFGTALTLLQRPVTVHLLANAGYDFLFIDTEHNHFAPDMLFEVVQSCRVYGICPIVRVADTEYHLIANILDTGAQGIIVPRVESRAQAEMVVECSKFRPVGRRGFGTAAILDFQPGDLAESLRMLNEELLVIVQIESAEAVACVDDIASVPGVDVLLIGPTDLSIALGHPLEWQRPDFVQAVDQVIAACDRHGIVSGFVGGSVPGLTPWWRKGMRFLSCGSETGLLTQAAAMAVAEYRALGTPDTHA